MNETLNTYDTWTRQTFQAAHHTDSGTTAQPVCGGITRGQWGIGRSLPWSDRYALTHLPTGRSIGNGTAPEATPDQLKQLADKLDKVIPDSEDMEEVVAMRDEYEPIVEEWAEGVAS